ncbi:FliM/FliN family flagellar motor switch protein [Salmonella enterica]|nr:FliM/FliN family flagellar motor switch protein [Salmonella enterica]
MLGLRKVNNADYQLNRAMSIWRDRGINVSKALPDVMANWTSIRDEQHRWQGWVQTRELMAIAGMHMTDLALTPDVEMLIIEWVNGDGNVPSLQIDELDCSKLVFGDRVDRLSADLVPMLKVSTPSFTIWLDYLDVILMRSGTGILNEEIKWQIDYVLGKTLISAGTMEKICGNDVLIIKEIDPYAACFNEKIFSWSYPEGIMTFTNEDTADIVKCSEENNFLPVSEEIIDLKKIPVKMEFILHSEIMTLANLESLTTGEMVSFPDNVEKRIEIRVNGIRLGEGELVEFNNKLAVEIQRWMGSENV